MEQPRRKGSRFWQWLSAQFHAHLTREEWLAAFRLGEANERRKINAGLDTLAWRERAVTPPVPVPPPIQRGLGTESLKRIIGTEHLPAVRKPGTLLRQALVEQRRKQGSL